MVKIIPLVFILASCATSGGTFCDIAKPIRLTPEQIATLSDSQVNQYLGHNKRGQKFCGWRP